MLEDMIKAQERGPSVTFKAPAKPSYISQVYALVASANEGVQPTRRVLKSTAFKVAVREYNRLSHLPQTAREFAALNEVAAFIDTAQTAKKPTPHTDLLFVGHPFSTSERRASLTAAAVLAEEGRWQSGHPDLPDEIRPLVAAAFSHPADSTPAKHAVARLSRTKLPTDIVRALEDREL